MTNVEINIRLIVLSILYGGWLLTLIFVPALVAGFFQEMAGEKVEACGEVEEGTEEYFECLQQNDLDTWDMEHKDTYLTIKWWMSFTSLTIFIGVCIIFPVVIQQVWED